MVCFGAWLLPKLGRKLRVSAAFAVNLIDLGCRRAAAGKKLIHSFNLMSREL
jgi:hypothetical protein